MHINISCVDALKESGLCHYSGSPQLTMFAHYFGSDVFNAENDPVSKGIESGLR